MADIEKKIHIDVEVSSADAAEKLDELSKKLEEVKNQADSTKSGLDGVSSDLQKTGKAGEEAEKGLEKTGKSLDDVSKKGKTGRQSLGEIWKSFKTGISSAKSLSDVFGVVGKSMWSLVTNPVGAVIGAIVLAVKGLTDAFKRNDDAGTALSKMWELLKVPLVMVQRVIDALVASIVPLIEQLNDKLAPVVNTVGQAFERAGQWIQNFSDAISRAAGYVKEHWGWIGEIIGKGLNFVAGGANAVGVAVENVGNKVKEGTATLTGYAAAVDRLEDAERAYSTGTAKRAREIAELRELVSDNEVDVDARLAALDKLEEAEDEQLKADIAIAKQRLNVQRLYMKQNNDNSDEQKDKETQLMNALIQTETNRLENQRKINKQRKSLLNEAAAKEKAFADAMNAINKRISDEQKKHLKNVVENNKDTMNAFALLSFEYAEEQQELANQIEETNKEIADLEEQLAATANEKTRKHLQEQIAALKQLVEAQGQTMADSTKKYENAVEALLKKTGGSIEEMSIDTETSFEQQRETLEDAYNAELESLNNALEEGMITREQYMQAQLALAEVYAAKKGEIDEAEAKKTAEEAQKAADAKKKAYSDLLGATASVFGSIASAYQDEYEKIKNSGEELSDEQRHQAIEALEKQKAATWIQFALQQAQAIGNAVVAATSAAAAGGPAAAVVFAATMATMTAGIISSFVSTKKSIEGIDAQIAEMKAPKKLARGGYVEGGGSSTSDSIPARLSNGESVINARSTAMYYDLLSRINQAGGGRAFPNAVEMPSSLRFAQGGVAYGAEAIGRTVRDAVKDIQPVVSVKEITRVQNKVKAKEAM